MPCVTQGLMDIPMPCSPSFCRATFSHGMYFRTRSSVGKPWLNSCVSIIQMISSIPYSRANARVSSIVS